MTNIVAGHHSIGALSVEDFEKVYGAEELQESDVRHKIMIIKINKLYQKGMEENVLYDSVRGIWRASMDRVKNVEYVFGVYNSLIVAVYKPTSWHSSLLYLSYHVLLYLFEHFLSLILLTSQLHPHHF